jgi:tetratricopeptide (TPR) repeat protein
VRSLLPGVEATAVAALGGAGELAQLVPEVKELVGATPRADGADPRAARFRLYEAVAEFLFLVAARHPLVVVIDDLHWADPLSVHLLAQLADRLERDRTGGARMLVVATYRRPHGDGSGPVAEVLGRLARVRAVGRLTLSGLSPAEVGRFMALAGGLDPTPEQVAAVHARTEGNPFFVGELSRLLAAEDPPAMEAVPEGVLDIVRRRLARLPEPTRSLLVVASVVGRDFDLKVVAAASQMDRDETVGLIEAAVATGIVVEESARPGHYRFSHALVRDTVYSQIGGLRRARLHARVGEAVADLPDVGGRTAELAHHFFRAAVVDGPGRGLAYALLAHEEARSSLAYEQAEEHLRRALELVAMMPVGQEQMRSELRVQNRLAAVLTVVDGFTAPTATRGWDRAGQLSDEVDDDVQGLASSWGLLSLSCVRGDVEATSRLARQLVLTGADPSDTASLMAGHFGLGRAALFCGDLREALARFSQARVLCDSLDDRARLDVFGWLDPAVLCRVNAALVHGLLGEQELAADWAAVGVQVAERAGHPLSVGASHMFNAAVAVLAGDPCVARRHGDRLLALATEHGLPDFVAAATIFRGWAAARLGEVDRGIAEIGEGIAMKRATGFRMWQTFDLGLLAETCRSGGRLDEAVAAVDDAVAQIEATGERFYEAELFRLRAELLIDRDPDAAEQARTGLAKAIAVATSQGAEPFRTRAEAALARLAGQAVTVPR